MAIMTNGTAILGLGDIGSSAGLPVMEGKSVLFKSLAGIDVMPICIVEKDP
jgi:malate dehydrogenase (oxaloacetate-decarboxylating)